MDLFDVYFRRADLDQDGRISGAEAVAFFQGSNLSKTVLAQIWMHADQNRTGFLGRPEFYNALKLVTVAQSKRELTPDMVKAALYGPASAKIPAPQINLNAIPTPHSNSPAASSLQMGAVAPTTTQNLGFRGQVPPNSNVNQQYFPSQGNHPARPPLPITGGPASRPPLGLSHSNISSDSIGGRTSGAPSGVIPQVPNREVSQSMPSVGPRPQVVLPTSSLTVAKDSKALVGSGNGFSSDSMFGGDVFSATSALPKHDSSVPTFSASGPPASSAIVPVSTATQSSAKPGSLDSLQSSFMRQSTGGQLQQTQSQFKPKQQIPSQSTSSVSFSSVEVGNSSSNQSQLPWPKMTPAGVQKYAKVFVEVDSDRDGKITGEQARNLFLSWRLPREILKQVWDLSDQDNDSMLSLREFCIALYLMERYREGRPLPTVLPSNILLDENLLSLTGQPNASYANTAWGPPAGMRPQPGMPGAQLMAPATGLRPPMPTVFTQADGAMQFNQHKARVPLMENSHMNQLSNGDQSPLNLVPQQEAETVAKVEDKAKVLLDSKEKIEFYRTKMQDLVLYKSRCDNRLNEITERALADKREAELLAKKYEEKYKQVAEIASKLTIEEATFRDIQERKMELNQAIIKMEQGGSADGILQVRADRIQSNLEDLMRALTERCKKHGKHVKSGALIELPIGWQPGVPEVSAVWDEDWDKFEDEGFSFDVKPTNAKSASVQKENSSTNDTLSPDSLSHDDGKSDELFNRSVLESESAYTHSEDESAKSPGGSHVRQTAFESPSQEYSNNHFRKSSEADTETHRSFDEPNWGTFDNNDDTDSVWGFNPSSARDSDHEKHGEKYFFGSDDFGTSPIRTESPQKRIPFAFEDSVPSTPLSRADNSSPRYSMGPVDPFFDNISRFDSFRTSEQGFSPRGETFTRFDSINSTRGFDHSRGLSSFDDADPFGSTGPFKVSSSESQTPRKGSENWGAF